MFQHHSYKTNTVNNQVKLSISFQKSVNEFSVMGWNKPEQLI